MDDKQITVPYILFEGEMARAERNRAILKRRLFDGITYERLAEEFDMSVRQIKTIVYKTEETIFKHIRGNSPDFSCEKIFSKNIKKSIDI